MNAFQLVQYLSTKPHDHNQDVMAYVNTHMLNNNIFIDSNLGVHRFYVVCRSTTVSWLAKSLQGFFLFKEDSNDSLRSIYLNPSLMHYHIGDKEANLHTLLTKLNRLPIYNIDDTLPLAERFNHLPEINLCSFSLIRHVIAHKLSLKAFIKEYKEYAHCTYEIKDYQIILDNIFQFYETQSVKDYFGPFLESVFMPLVDEINKLGFHGPKIVHS